MSCNAKKRYNQVKDTVHWIPAKNNSETAENCEERQKVKSNFG